jgi:hypothetical protein
VVRIFARRTFVIRLRNWNTAVDDARVIDAME